MPAGFPNIRHDPTTEPRYIVRTVPSGSNKVVTKSADGVPEKMSKYQYPVVKGMLAHLIRVWQGVKDPRLTFRVLQTTRNPNLSLRPKNSTCRA